MHLNEFLNIGPTEKMRSIFILLILFYLIDANHFLFTTIKMISLFLSYLILFIFFHKTTLEHDAPLVPHLPFTYCQCSLNPFIILSLS